jgi:hypothetical protein
MIKIMTLQAITRRTQVKQMEQEPCVFLVFVLLWLLNDRLCGLVVRVLGYRYGGPVSIHGTTRKKSSGSGTGSTQPREYN